MKMDHFRTQYEKLYEGESYYWGTDPADFLEKLMQLMQFIQDLNI